MISVIIPTYNEEGALPETLRCLFAQPGDYEVLIVDGGSIDQTRSVAEFFGFSACETWSRRSFLVSRRSSDASRDTRHAARYFLMAAKGRALQMNAGAKEARGEWLLFLHADTTLPPDAVEQIRNAIRGDYPCGCSRLQCGQLRGVRVSACRTRWAEPPACILSLCTLLLLQASRAQADASLATGMRIHQCPERRSSTGRWAPEDLSGKPRAETLSVSLPATRARKVLEAQF